MNIPCKSNSVGSKRNHWKKLLSVGKSVNVGWAGLRLHLRELGCAQTSLVPQTVLELSLEQSQDLGAPAQSMDRAGLQLEGFSLC